MKQFDIEIEGRGHWRFCEFYGLTLSFLIRMQTHAKNNVDNFSGYAAAAKITKLTFWKFSIEIKTNSWRPNT